MQKVSGNEEVVRNRLNFKILARAGGEGGLIAVNAKDEICLPFNSEGMNRAWMGKNGNVHSVVD